MNAIKETVINDFRNAMSINNFRLSADGTLEKREGFTLIRDFGEPIRAVASDEKASYAVAGNDFYEITGSVCNFIGQLSECEFESETEKGYIFITGGAVYIMGGGAYYRYIQETGILEPVKGYAPLIRRKGTIDSHGEEYEVRNLLTPNVRMSFLVSGISGQFSLYGSVSKIISITCAGKIIPPDYYSAIVTTTKKGLITISSDYVFEDSEIIVEYQLRTEEYPIKRKEFLTEPSVYILNDENGKRLFLYKCETGKIYTSEFNSETTAAKENYDYFPEGAHFTVGDCSKPTNAIAAVGSQTVIFTSGGIHELIKKEHQTPSNVPSQKFSTKYITTEIGITDNSGTILYEDELYLLTKNGLYRFSYNSREYEYSAERIDFAEHASPSDTEYSALTLFLLRKNSELWCASNDGAYVYSLKFKQWYKFSGFKGAGHMFIHCGDAAFYSDSCFYVFTEGGNFDAGKGFEAVYIGKRYDLGSIFANKTVYGFGAAFDRIENARLICTLTNDKGIDCTAEFSSDNSDAPTPMVARVPARLGGCSYVICKLVSPSNSAACNIRSIMIRFRESGGAK